MEAAERALPDAAPVIAGNDVAELLGGGLHVEVVQVSGVPKPLRQLR